MRESYHKRISVLQSSLSCQHSGNFRYISKPNWSTAFWRWAIIINASFTKYYLNLYPKYYVCLEREAHPLIWFQIVCFCSEMKLECWSWNSPHFIPTKSILQFVLWMVSLLVSQKIPIRIKWPFYPGLDPLHFNIHRKACTEHMGHKIRLLLRSHFNSNLKKLPSPLCTFPASLLHGSCSILSINSL